MASLPPFLRRDGLLLLSVTIWGFNFVILKAALVGMHPHVLNLFRMLISGAVLGGMHALGQRRRQAPFFAPLRTHGRQIVLLGLLGYAFYQICFIIGIDRTTAGNGALIMTSVPLWAAVISHIFRLERISGGAWAGLLVSLMGTISVVVLRVQDLSMEGVTLIGNALILCAAVAWGSYTAFNKPVLREVDPISLTFLGLLISLPLLVAYAVPYWHTVAWAEVDAWVWLAILYSGGLSTGLATAWWNVSIKAVGTARTAIYGNLIPFIALVAGWVFLGEPITWLQFGGGVLIVAGLVMMRRAKPLPAAPPR